MVVGVLASILGLGSLSRGQTTNASCAPSFSWVQAIYILRNQLMIPSLLPRPRIHFNNHLVLSLPCSKVNVIRSEVGFLTAFTLEQENLCQSYAHAFMIFPSSSPCLACFEPLHRTKFWPGDYLRMQYTDLYVDICVRSMSKPHLDLLAELESELPNNRVERVSTSG